MLFTYLHLAPDPAQTEGLMKSGATCIAYETVTAPTARLPLLKPMSEVAGRMSIQVGAHYLEKAHGGRGVLLGGVPGVRAGEGRDPRRRRRRRQRGADGGRPARRRHHARQIHDAPGRARLCILRPARTVYSTKAAIAEAVDDADLVIGAVLIPGAAAPKLVTRDMLKTMKPGSVLVDISIDQGGCFETSRPTTHDDPIYAVDGIVHYCVANMPGAVPRTSTFALNNATLPFALKLANQGAEAALKADSAPRQWPQRLGRQDPPPRGGRGAQPALRSRLSVAAAARRRSRSASAPRRSAADSRRAVS